MQICMHEFRDFDFFRILRTITRMLTCMCIKVAFDDIINFVTVVLRCVKKQFDSSAAVCELRMKRS